MFRTLLLALAIFSTTVCSTNTSVLSPTDLYGAYTATVLTYAATRDGMPTEVEGKFLPCAAGGTRASHYTIHEGRAFRTDGRLHYHTAGGVYSSYRVVLIFDAALNSGRSSDTAARHQSFEHPSQALYMTAHLVLRRARESQDETL